MTARSRAGLFVLALAACGGERETPPADPPPAAPSTAPRADPETAGVLAPAAGPALEGLEGLEGLETTPELSLPEVEPGGELPEHGCVVSDAPVRALAGAGRPAVARGAGAFFVGAYVRAGAGEAVAVARLPDGEAPVLFATLPIERGLAEGARRAGPGLAFAADGRLLVAATDADGAVLEAELAGENGAAAGALRVVAPEAHGDGRFAPAITATTGATILAWTDGSGTPMRVRLLALDRTGRALGEHEVTPEAGGAAAPSFGRGELEPTLYVVDPRVALSVVSRSVLAADGTPGPIEVTRPLARAADPASFVVVRSAGIAFVAYTAVGTSGSRAVGLLRAGGSEPPVPVVPGLGFGAPIAVDGAALAHGAVLAAEAPSAADPTAPHDVRVRVLTEEGTLSEPLTIPNATEPAISAGSGDAVIVATEGGFVTRLRCR